MHTHRVCRVCVKNELFHSLSGITASLTIGFHDTAGLGHQRPGGRSGPGSERGSQRNRLRMGMGNKKAGRSLAHSGPRAGANHIWFGLWRPEICSITNNYINVEYADSMKIRHGMFQHVSTCFNRRMIPMRKWPRRTPSLLKKSTGRGSHQRCRNSTTGKAGTGTIRTPMRQLTMAREKQHRGRMKTARGRVETQIGPLGRVGAAGNGPRRKTETLNLRHPHPLVHMATPPLRPQRLWCTTLHPRLLLLLDLMDRQLLKLPCRFQLAQRLWVALPIRCRGLPRRHSTMAM